MFKIPYEKGTGVFRDKKDWRDYSFDAMFGDSELDWETGYELEPVTKGKLKVEKQQPSLSCVGQGYKKYGEVLNYFEEEKIVDLSAKSIYGIIYLPSGGAYMRSGAELLVNRGVNSEKIVPSYDVSGVATEGFMRDFNRTPELDSEAKTYQSHSYFNVSKTIDSFARAIKNGNGLVFAVKGNNSNWYDGNVKPPAGFSNTWGHCIYAVGYRMFNGKKQIKFINSWGKGWGEDGYGYLDEDYFVDNAKYVYLGWTMIDKKNIPSYILKNPKIADANPNSIANREYVDALFMEYANRYASASEIRIFTTMTAKGAANFILGAKNSPFYGR